MTPWIDITYDGQTQSPGNCNSGYTITRQWTAEDDCEKHQNGYPADRRIRKPTFARWEGPVALDKTGKSTNPATEQRNNELPLPAWRLKADLAPNPALTEVNILFELEEAGEVTLSVV